MSDLSRSRGDVGFADRLESVYTLGVFLPDLHHLPKGTLANHFEKIESINGKRNVPGRFEIDLEVEGT